MALTLSGTACYCIGVLGEAVRRGADSPSALLGPKPPSYGTPHLTYESSMATPPEGFGLLPFLAVLVAAADRDVVSHSRCRLVLPDRGLDRPETDFMDRLLFCLRHRRVPRRVRVDRHTSYPNKTLTALGRTHPATRVHERLRDGKNQIR